MMLQELLRSRKIDLEKTKLMRHSLGDGMAGQSYALGYFDDYQALQRANRLKDCEYFLSFLSCDGTGAKFYGFYKVVGHEPFKRELFPSNFPIGEKDLSHCVKYELEKLDTLEDMENRLVIDWGKSTRNWLQNATTLKEIMRILPKISENEFESYEKVILTYDELKNIVNNNKEHKVWQDKLSAVAGIYLITDTKTGKHYVGSASSYEKGIWGRWSDYAQTKHGGNKRLMDLVNADELYCNNFKFSILEIFPIKRDISEIREYEQLYKSKLCSIRFGLNDN